MTAPREVFRVLTQAAFLLLVTAAPLPAQPAQPDQGPAAERGAPAAATVTVWNRPIVVFRATVRQVRPPDRAANAARRIHALPNVTNYSRLAGTDGAVVATSVTIGYDQPWRQVHALLLLAAERTPGVRKERFRVLSDLHAQIQDAFNEFEVQIMSPAFESQPDRAVVVPKSKWFAAPARPPQDAQGGSQ